MKLNVLNLVRPSVTETGFSSPVYQAHQRDYNERYSIHAQNAARWRLTSFGCIALAGLAVGGLVYAAAQNKYVPYVVERDSLGDQVAIGMAQQADEPDLRVIQTTIRNWLYDIRTVSPDAQTERHLIEDAYNHTNKDASANGELTDWFKQNNPFKRAAESIVTITVTSALPVDPHSWKTWRANWKEETRNRSGDLESSALKEVSITVSYNPPSKEAQFKTNPAGIFVDYFDWKN